MARQTGDQHWTRRRLAAGLPAGNLNNRNRYMIEAIVDGTWHWYAGRSEIKPYGTLWHTTNDKAVVFTRKDRAQREQRTIGGRTFLRKVVQ